MPSFLLVGYYVPLEFYRIRQHRSDALLRILDGCVLVAPLALLMAVAEHHIVPAASVDLADELAGVLDIERRILSVRRLDFRHDNSCHSSTFLRLASTSPIRSLLPRSMACADSD